MQAPPGPGPARRRRDRSASCRCSTSSGSTSCSGCPCAAGSPVVLVERFDPVVGARGHRATTASPSCSGAPPMWHGVGRAARRRRRRRSPAVRLAASGAAPLPVEVAGASRTASACDPAEGYGLTEASPVVTSSAGVDAPARARSACRCPASRCGWSTPTARTRSSATPARSGCGARTCSRATGRTQDATAARSTADGWLRTGDIAVVDDDGYLYLVDRAKDLIIVSGFNVYPGRGRGGAARASRPSSEPRWSGVAHPHTGEAVKAYVVAGAEATRWRRTSSSSSCADRLARYKCPDQGHLRRRPPPKRHRQGAEARPDRLGRDELADHVEGLLGLVAVRAVAAARRTVRTARGAAAARRRSPPRPPPGTPGPPHRRARASGTTMLASSGIRSISRCSGRQCSISS